MKISGKISLTSRNLILMCVVSTGDIVSGHIKITPCMVFIILLFSLDTYKRNMHINRKC